MDGSLCSSSTSITSRRVNDTLGHPIGDVLLKQVSERLQACIRDGDTVARFGGDEFAMLLPEIDAVDPARQLAQRVIDVVARPYEVDGNQVNIGTSIGIAFAPSDGAYPDKLLKNADMALYRAKLSSRGTCCFFEQAMEHELQTRRTLELDMRKAIVENQFELYYQPLVDVQSRTISGFEALIRWNHPTQGLIARPCYPDCRRDRADRPSGTVDPPPGMPGCCVLAGRPEGGGQSILRTVR